MAKLWPTRKGGGGTLLVCLCNSLGDTLIARPSALWLRSAGQQVTLLVDRRAEGLYRHFLPGFPLIAINGPLFEGNLVYRLAVLFRLRRRAFDRAATTMGVRSPLGADTIIARCGAAVRVAPSPPPWTKARWFGPFAKIAEELTLQLAEPARSARSDRRVLGDPVCVPHELERTEAILQALTGKEVTLPMPDLRPLLAAPPSSRGNESVVIFLGASHAVRRPPPEQILRLASRLASQGFKPKLLCGPAEGALLAYYEAALQAADLQGVSLVTPKSLDEMLSIIASARLYIGYDSGPSHVALQLQRPSVVVTMANNGDQQSDHEPTAFGAHFPYPTRFHNAPCRTLYTSLQDYRDAGEKAATWIAVRQASEALLHDRGDGNDGLWGQAP